MAWGAMPRSRDARCAISGGAMPSDAMSWKAMSRRRGSIEERPVARCHWAGHDSGMDDLGLLLLQIEWGADEALEDTPIDRLRPPAAALALAPAGGRARPEPFTPLLAPQVAQLGTPAERAMRAAAGASSLGMLKAAIAGFEGDPLRDMATNMVFAAGDTAAGILLIGGPPGAEDDRSGVPFSGAEGALLDAMLASVGVARDRFLLAPLIPWRPPGGRVPSPGELQLYRPFLIRLIGLAGPERIVLFGAMAAGTVLGAARRPRDVGWVEASIDGVAARVLVLPALADVLKSPARGKDVWAGLRRLRRVLTD